jgi:hypothetical protein
MNTSEINSTVRCELKLGLANNPIKQSARSVTRLARARRAPERPAAYRVRWTDSVEADESAMGDDR